MSALWQAARQQVAEYEQRSAQLSLTLSTEKSALEAVERETKKLEEERAALAKRAAAAEEAKAAAARVAAEARAAAEAAAGQHRMLQKHLELLRGEQRAAGGQMEEDRQRYQGHLTSLRAQLAAYRDHLAAAAAAEA